MAKRAATTQMTHDNWDHEDEETEDPGEFAAASSDELAQRKIRVAKRRLAGDSSKSSGGSIFSSFAGFGAKPSAQSTPVTASPSFNFPSTPLFGTGLPSFPSSIKATSAPFTGLSGSKPVTNKLPDFVVQPSKQPTETAPVDSSKRVKVSDIPAEYNSEVKALNGSVIAWMQENYQEDPFVDFAPVFNDYKKHLKELAEKYNVKVVSSGNETTESGIKVATNADGVAKASPAEYYADLKALNGSVIAWMQENYQENPFVDFAPVFDDYKNHFKQLAEKFHVNAVSKGNETTDNGTKEAVNTGTGPSEYNVALKELNGSVIARMQESYQKHPFTDFTSIFNDYQKRLKELEEKNNMKPVSIGNKATDAATKDAISARPPNAGAVTNANGPPSIFAFSHGSTAASKTAPAPVSESQPSPQPFKFGLGTGGLSAMPVVPTVTVSAPRQDLKPFSFGFQSTTTAPSLTATASAPTFSFGGTSSSATPFSFGFKQPEKPAESDEKDGGNGGEEEGEYEPPKPERVEQVEEDAFHNVRCKLFYKKDGKFVEKGVGTLFLKPLESGKNQLLIRADTATGNILLNVSLNESIPCSRNGKNNVTVVCVPHPPLDPKAAANEPAVLLIRVKTAEEADKLQEEITKAKSGA